MRLLRRHLLHNLAGPFLFAWIAQTGMLMLNQLSRRFGDLVGKGLPSGVIAEVLLLFVPFIVALTLPMAILVAVLYGFSQMGSDNELTAMRANGVSVLQMLRPVFAAGVLLSLTNFVFIDQVLPRTNLRLLNLQTDIAQKKPTFSLKEQTINNLPQSQYFLQASRIEPGTGRMREVVIYDLSPPLGRRVIYADSGYMSFEHGEQDLSIQLYLGRVNEYKSAEPGTVNVTRFRGNRILVRNIQNAFRQSFGTVQKGDREMTTCEMMDHVAGSRREAARAAARRSALGSNDLRALLRLYSVPEAARADSTLLPDRCGAWRRFERWMGRLLLPKAAAAQVPVTPPPPPPPPLVAVDSSPVAGPPVAAFATLNDVTAVRDEEAFAIRDVHQYSVEIHKKFALSVACMNFVLIGIALALRFPRGGIGLVIGGSLVIFALFYVGLTAGENLADRGSISPALAMWLPNAIVFVAGVLGLVRVNREFGSTRGGDLADLADTLLGWIRRRRS
jgi:lipopolysaccharide export system permease protein